MLEYPLVTKQDILDAYKRTGLIPKRFVCIGYNHEIKDCGCVRGALARLIKADCNDIEAYDITANKYGKDNASSLQYGFDYSQHPIDDSRSHSPYYMAGREAALELFGAKNGNAN